MRSSGSARALGGGGGGGGGGVFFAFVARRGDSCTPEARPAQRHMRSKCRRETEAEKRPSQGEIYFSDLEKNGAGSPKNRDRS